MTCTNSIVLILLLWPRKYKGGAIIEPLSRTKQQSWTGADMQQTAVNTQSLLMNAKEAASITGLSSRTIVRMCDSGELPAVKLGNSWRINREKFMQLIGLK